MMAEESWKKIAMRFEGSFEKKLHNVSRAVKLRSDIGSFLSFCNFFFDNFLINQIV